MKGILWIAVLLTVPFLFTGIIQRVKSLWAGRRGPALLQPMWDTMRLLRKGEVISSVTSFVFSAGASIYLASMIVAALLIGPHPCHALVSFPGDFVVFAYLLGFGRFFLILSAMDTGSSFEGMGASREITFATLVEPAFFILLGSLALLTGQTSLSSLFNHLGANSEGMLLLRVIGVPVLFLMLLVEGSRGPVDDPATHLELTMIHEVMVLDHSGPNLAFILYGSYLKMILIVQLIAGLIIPPSFPILLYSLLWAAVLAGCAVTVGLIESLMARVRMSHNPQLIFVMMALALMAFASAIYFVHGGI
jgi:formate hydrogenlyase subunit 4